MDWTATAFGLLVTVIGTLSTGMVLLAKRELDRRGRQADDLDRRLRVLEASHVLLAPVATAMEGKLQKCAKELVLWRDP